MELEFNVKAREVSIKSAFDEIISQIAKNLANGEVNTDMYIDKSISSAVRNMLIEEFKRQGKNDNFHWCTLRQERNTLGNHVMKYYISETIGDQKHYKLKYTV